MSPPVVQVLTMLVEVQEVSLAVVEHPLAVQLAVPAPAFQRLNRLMMDETARVCEPQAFLLLTAAVCWAEAVQIQAAEVAAARAVCCASAPERVPAAPCSRHHQHFYRKVSVLQAVAASELAVVWEAEEAEVALAVEAAWAVLLVERVVQVEVARAWVAVEVEAARAWA